MDILNDKSMHQQTQWWQPIFDWIRDNTIVFASFAITWKGIDKVFKYFSEARDTELRKIVHDEMNPSIQSLTEKIEKLSEAIWGMKQNK